MLNRAFGAMTGAAVAAAVGAAIAAFQGSQSDAGARALWITVVVGAVAAVVFGLGWLLTRKTPNASANPTRNATAKAGHLEKSALTQITGDHNSVVFGVPQSQPILRHRFVENRDDSRGVLSHEGRIWWRLKGWNFGPYSDKPTLSIEPRCPVHGVAFLSLNTNTDRFERADRDHSNARGARMLFFECPKEDPRLGGADNPGWRQVRLNAWEIADALMDHAARENGWDRPPE